MLYHDARQQHGQKHATADPALRGQYAEAIEFLEAALNEPDATSTQGSGNVARTIDGTATNR